MEVVPARHLLRGVGTRGSELPHPGPRNMARKDGLQQVPQVGRHGGGGRAPARAPALVDRGPEEVRVHQDAVELLPHPCQGMSLRNQRGEHGHQRRPFPHARLGDELEHETAVQAELDVFRRHPLDAFAVHVGRFHPAAEGEAGKETDLLGRIPAAHIERRIGLREPLFLRLAQGLTEGELVLGHVGKDVVRRSVHDAHDAPDPVAHEAFLQDLDDGDASADRGLELELHAVGGGQGNQLPAVGGEQGLVRRDDVLLARQRLTDEREGSIHATGELHHDGHAGIVQDLPPPAHQPCARADGTRP